MQQKGSLNQGLVTLVQFMEDSLLYLLVKQDQSILVKKNF